MKSSVIEKIKSAPKDPGVYIFRGRGGVLYVGKAANLRARLKSYLKITDAKTQSLHEESTKLDYLTLRSEIEALIEESRLIKALKPKYNILWRDDKSYLYIGLTRETTTKVFITHRSLNPKRYTPNPLMIGPFTDGAALRLVMKLLRRQFPHCTCFQPHLRDCLNAQIGKCLGFCCRKDLTPTPEQLKIYKKNIRAIKMILRGQSKKLLKTLTDEKEKWALEKIFKHRDYLAVGEFLRKPSRRPSGQGVRRTSEAESERNFLAGEIDSVFSRMFSDGTRVECYDNSNFAGKEAVGAMTVLKRQETSDGRQEWTADKSQWRKFKIKSSPTRDDPRMMYEIVSRRLKHPEWPYPDLIIIDGGLTQLNAALKAQSEIPEAKNIKITAYPKPQKTLLGWPNAPEEILKLAERAIYQTHNFVIRYHRQMRSKEFLGN